MPRLVIDTYNTLPPFPFLIWNRAAIQWMLEKKGFDLSQKIDRRHVKGKYVVEYTQEGGNERVRQAKVPI